ncbi:MAG TPA: type II toxin-antitoxin system HicA family toxin [Chloroflexota bacterium]|nr:type II toxin-antitoxin system HicA family toxin [Chloroflexota bacterium]
MRHPTKPGRVAVARHAGTIIKPKTLASVMREAGLTVDELRELL